MGDKTKLPKWAQDKINQLEKSLGIAQRDLRNAYSKEKTNILVDPWSADVSSGGNKPKAYIPERATIRFMFDKKRYIDVLFRDGKLDIRGEAILMVTPWAANVIKVDVEDRWGSKS